MAMYIEIEDGVRLPVDPRFVLTAGLGADGKPVALSASGKTEVVTASTVSGAHTIDAGAKAVTLVASSDFVGTVATVALNGSESITFRASPGNTLGTIAITRSAGSLRVWEQR